MIVSLMMLELCHKKADWAFKPPTGRSRLARGFLATSTTTQTTHAPPQLGVCS